MPSKINVYDFHFFFQGIFGGHSATKGKYPFIVSLSTYIPIAFRDVHDCTGSIINKRWILTAASCITSSSPLNVSVGSYSLNGPRTFYKVKDKYPHFNYNRSSANNNIGLIQLEEDIIFNDTVKPVKLPMSSSDPVGDIVSVAGWGVSKVCIHIHIS